MHRIDTLYYWHTKFNKEEFGDKMVTPILLAKKTNSIDGYYEYRSDRSWLSIEKPEKAVINIGAHCWEDEDLLKGTLLHEMVHQYQVEILRRKPSHDAIFCSIARRLERKYNITVR